MKRSTDVASTVNYLANDHTTAIASCVCHVPRAGSQFTCSASSKSAPMNRDGLLNEGRRALRYATAEEDCAVHVRHGARASLLAVGPGAQPQAMIASRCSSDVLHAVYYMCVCVCIYLYTHIYIYIYVFGCLVARYRCCYVHSTTMSYIYACIVLSSTALPPFQLSDREALPRAPRGGH